MFDLWTFQQNSTKIVCKTFYPQIWIYFKINLSQMCQTAPFDRRQLTLFWSVGKFQKYFCKIMHAIDVRSSPVVRSAEFVDFTGDVFSNVFTEISWVCAKRLENLFDLHIFKTLMVGFEREAKINRSISKMAVICYFSSLEDLIRWNEVTFIFIFLLTKYK